MRNALLPVAAVLGLLAGSVHGADPWSNEAWRYRLLVELPVPDLRAGINTARLSMADQSALCLPDGRDLRVTTRSGRPVRHRVEARDDRTLDLLFELTGGDSRFYVYYGNPSAPGGESSWNERTGGLTLEVRPTAGPILSPEQEYARNRTPYGRKPWGQIYDLSNPFAPARHPFRRGAGPNDFYLSIYDGVLLCPRTGNYTFGINSDDGATFYLGRGGRLPRLCSRIGGVPSSRLPDVKQPAAVQTLRLERGLYRLRYLHVENTGGQMAKLLWQQPGDEGLELVPLEAFVQYVPVRIAGRQEQGAEFCPFFDVEHRFNLKVNAIEDTFPNYRFRFAAGWEDAGARGRDGWRWEWDFGDGAAATGPDVEHEFPDAHAYQVTLKVTRPDGRWARVARTVKAPAGPVREMSIEMQVSGSGILLGPGEPVKLQVLVAARKGGRRMLELRSSTVGRDQEARAVGAEEIIVDPVPVDAAEDRWVSTELIHRSGGDEACLHLCLLLHGREVASERVMSVGTGGPLKEVRLDHSQNLRDATGALVRLVPAGLTRGGAPARRLTGPDGKVRVLVLDELLAGPPGGPTATGYVGELAALLRRRYPALKFEFLRSSAQEGAGSFPVLKLLHVAEAVARYRPHLVVLVWPPQSVVDGLPVGQFERYLGAALDQVLASSRAEVVVVTSPPLPGHPELAFEYARAAKKVGLRVGVPVVDLYSRFLLTENWLSLFRTGRGAHESYLLYPSAQGQAEVAREIYATLVEAFHEDLSIVARSTAMQRAAEASVGPPRAAAGALPD